MRVLIIPVEGPIEDRQIDGQLDDLQALVGGYIEAVALPDFITGADQATAYVNEEGKLDGLAPNFRATDFMVPGVGLMWGDYIAGPMVLAGFDPETGEHTADIPPAVVRRAHQIAQEA
jgi:hypothetical protein